MTLTMPATYTPSAPTGVGTDDYRCFLLDPELDEDVWLTGSNVLPGNPQRRAPRDPVPGPARARRGGRGQGRQTDGRGLDLLRRHRLAGEFQDIDDANWLAAWAPGGDETKVQNGYGVKLDAGSRIVMQVHYNLLKGAAPDRSATQLRWMAGGRDLTPLHTYLMPAPVELPCRPDHDDGPALRPRAPRPPTSMKRFGQSGNTNSCCTCSAAPTSSRRRPRPAPAPSAAG